MKKIRYICGTNINECVQWSADPIKNLDLVNFNVVSQGTAGPRLRYALSV